MKRFIPTFRKLATLMCHPGFVAGAPPRDDTYTINHALKGLLFVAIFLAGGMATHAQQTRILRIGTQSVTLTSDKRSSPALAVQMPEGDIWYGYLVSGTAPGRLTVQMPGGQIHSLIVPPGQTFSTIWADFPQVWTWDLDFRNTHPSYNGSNVAWTTNHNAILASHGLWPTYHLQAMCSNTTGTYPNRGTPHFANNGIQCWCRLKRRSDGANGGWVFVWSHGTGALCANACPARCANNSVDASIFRTALFNAFANP